MWGPTKKKVQPVTSAPTIGQSYKGFKIPHVNYQVDRVPADIAPEDFFNNYVAQRKPCVFTGLIQDSNFKCRQWSNEYLIEKAGKAVIEVEQRGSSSDTYGLGDKVNMTFEQFINILEQKQQPNNNATNEIEQKLPYDRYYMTTQHIDEDKDGLVDITASPVTELLTDLPLPPKLMGSLILWQMNLWMGQYLSSPFIILHHLYIESR